MTEPFAVTDEEKRNLGVVADAAEAAQAPTAPRGEMEQRLRRENPVGQLVEMANGDVVYIPVVTYTVKFFTGDEGKPETTLERQTAFENEALEKIISQEDVGDYPLTFDWLMQKVYQVFRENYPALRPEEMETWTGQISTNLNDSNDVVTAIIETFTGIRKKSPSGG